MIQYQKSKIEKIYEFYDLAKVGIIKKICRDSGLNFFGKSKFDLQKGNKLLKVHYIKAQFKKNKPRLIQKQK